MTKPKLSRQDTSSRVDEEVLIQFGQLFYYNYFPNVSSRLIKYNKLIYILIAKNTNYRYLKTQIKIQLKGEKVPRSK